MGEYSSSREIRSENAAVYGSGAIYTRPYDYSDPVLGTYTGSLTHEAIVSGYTPAPSGLVKGNFIYAKSGNEVFFYDDFEGKNQVGAAGGKGGQANAPSRSGVGVTPEYVGVFTGNATANYIQVEWINKWWQNGTLLKKGAYKTENKISWVRISNVEWQSTYVIAEDRQDEINNAKAQADALAQTSGTGTSTDYTTLGIAALGAAFLLRKKKKKS